MNCSLIISLAHDLPTQTKIKHCFNVGAIPLCTLIQDLNKLKYSLGNDSESPKISSRLYVKEHPSGTSLLVILAI